MPGGILGVLHLAECPGTSLSLMFDLLSTNLSLLLPLADRPEHLLACRCVLGRRVVIDPADFGFDVQIAVE